MKYRKLKGWKYQLVEPFMIQLGFSPLDNIRTGFIVLGEDKMLLLARHYAWDGASGPCPDTPNIMKGALVHDALYQLIRLGLLGKNYRKQADMELKRICLESGMSQFWASVVYWACRLFAAKATQPQPQAPVYQIP